jgi:hypothetical protein
VVRAGGSGDERARRGGDVPGRSEVRAVSATK